MHGASPRWPGPMRGVGAPPAAGPALRGGPLHHTAPPGEARAPPHRGCPGALHLCAKGGSPLLQQGPQTLYPDMSTLLAKGDEGAWRELLTGTLKDVAAASSWRAGTACGWEMLALGRNIYLRLGLVGRRLTLKSFQLVSSRSVELFAPLLSPRAAAGSQGAEGSPWLLSSHW